MSMPTSRKQDPNNPGNSYNPFGSDSQTMPGLIATNHDYDSLLLNFLNNQNNSSISQNNPYQPQPQSSPVSSPTQGSTGGSQPQPQLDYQSWNQPHPGPDTGGQNPQPTFNVNQPTNMLSTPGQFTGQPGIQGLTVGSIPSQQFSAPSPTQNLTTTTTPTTTGPIEFQAGSMGPGAVGQLGGRDLERRMALAQAPGTTPSLDLGAPPPPDQGIGALQPPSGIQDPGVASTPPDQDPGLSLPMTTLWGGAINGGPGVASTPPGWVGYSIDHPGPNGEVNGGYIAQPPDQSIGQQAGTSPQDVYNSYSNVLQGTPGAAYTPNFAGTQGGMPPNSDQQTAPQQLYNQYSDTLFGTPAAGGTPPAQQAPQSGPTLGPGGGLQPIPLDQYLQTLTPDQLTMLQQGRYIDSGELMNPQPAASPGGIMALAPQ